jgi:ribosomal protein L7/L12
MTKLLQEHLGVSLQEAKRATDDVLGGRPIAYNLEESQAKALAKALESVGAVIEIRDGN